jgi:hypothetical protein
MKAYEFFTRISPDGRLDLPTDVIQGLPRNRRVRVLILIEESDPEDNGLHWQSSTSEFNSPYDGI